MDDRCLRAVRRRLAAADGLVIASTTGSLPPLAPPGRVAAGYTRHTVGCRATGVRDEFINYRGS